MGMPVAMSHTGLRLNSMSWAGEPFTSSAGDHLDISVVQTGLIMMAIVQFVQEVERAHTCRKLVRECRPWGDAPVCDCCPVAV